MNYSTPEMRRRYRQHFLECRAIYRRQDETGLRLRTPPFPEDLRGMACSAKTRKGTPCKRTDLYLSGRCKFHGGMSTGPKTLEGKARVACNGSCSRKSDSKNANN
jgi:hypothetical protein